MILNWPWELFRRETSSSRISGKAPLYIGIIGTIVRSLHELGDDDLISRNVEVLGSQTTSKSTRTISCVNRINMCWSWHLPPLSVQIEPPPSPLLPCRIIMNGLMECGRYYLRQRSPRAGMWLNFSFYYRSPRKCMNHWPGAVSVDLEVVKWFQSMWGIASVD